MEKISFNDFEKAMSYDVVNNNACIEVEFSIEDAEEYTSCWLGKMPDPETSKEIYWFGLVEDGSQAYDFDTFEQFASAKVFRTNCLKELWPLVFIYSIDGCDVEERLPYLLGLKKGQIQRPAK